MQRKCNIGKKHKKFFVFAVKIILSLALLCISSAPAFAASSSVVVVEPGQPGETPPPPQTNTRDATMGDEARPVPVRIVRQPSANVVSQEPHVSVAPSAGTETSTGGPVSIQNPTLTTGAEVGRWEPRHKAIRAWSASPFLDPASQEETLSQVFRNRLTRVLLAFEPGEIQTLHTPEGAQYLNDLLKSAADHGVTVDLLLKTPARPEAEIWDDLKAQIAFFGAFPFQSLHLDLDSSFVVSATGSRRMPAERLIAALEAVVTGAASAGFRSIGISVDPRIMESGFEDMFASAFYRLNLAEVALKIYSTDAENAASRFQAICRFYPDLSLSLVQSIGSDRPRTESYFTAGVAIFGRRMRKLCFDVAAGNAQDLIFDSWEDYIQMAP